LLEISWVASAAALAVVPGLRSTKRMTALSIGVHPWDANDLEAWMYRLMARIESASSNRLEGGMSSATVRCYISYQKIAITRQGIELTVIAIEEHWMMPELASALAALPDEDRDESLAFNELGDHAERLRDLGDERILAMDAQGIDLSILSVTPPGTHPLAPADAVRLSQAANDAAAAAVASHPLRFRALSTLPMSSPRDVADELERAAALGHVGAMVYGRAGDRFLDDPVYEHFFATAERLAQPVFIHPQIPSRALRDASYRGFDPITELGLASFGWGWHVEAATAALRLILRGTFDRHPGLQVVLGHWGELLPFWVDRIDSLSRVAGLQRTVSDYLRSNFSITASGMLNPALLRHTLSVTSIDRLLFSTDYPFQHPTREDIAVFLDEFESDADRQAFTSANAVSLFGLNLTGP